jgi:ABC-2 type transport system permease protein
MKLRAGSFAWLAAHDLRQSWRGFDAAIGGLTRLKALALIGALMGVHGAVWWGLRFDGPDGALAQDVLLSRYLGVGLLFILPGIVAQAMNATTRALYAHGDLELLLSAPVSARAVLGARALAIAADAVAWFAILLLPLANVNALAGRPHWLAIYPALLACGLFGAAIGIALALAFFAALGPRRARLVSQIAAAIIGASFMLFLQGYASAPGGARAALMNALQPQGGASALDWRLLWSLPVRAAAGDLPAMALWMTIALAVFAVIPFALGGDFAKAAIASSGAPASAPRGRKARAFSGSLGATMRAKERRLVLRDPWLISQIMLQILYMLPISVILLRNGGVTGSPGIAFTPLIVVVGAQLAGSLTWLALSAEDAPDLLRAAPIETSRIERHKIQAVLAPIALLLAAPIVALAFVAPQAALWAALFTLGAGVSTALLNLWRQSPSPRGMMLRRHSQSKIVGMLEHLLAIVWAIGAAMAAMGLWTALVPVLLACLILWLSRSPRRRLSLPAGA